jgi:arylsulfatase A-like enzyme
MLPSKHGAHENHRRLDEHPMVFPEVLSSAGYQTVAISNNTWISEEFGFRRGFDIFRKNWQLIQSEVDLGEIARTKEGIGKIRQAAHRIFDRNPLVNVANAVYGQFLRGLGDDDGAQKTNEWLREWLVDRDDTNPFFLFVNYLEPHLEYRPPREYARRFLPDDVSYDEAMEVNQNPWQYITRKISMGESDFEILKALYWAEIAYLDERIDKLCQYLKDSGEWENTVFIITSDHGENIGEHGLMNHQYSLYDTLLHVPLIIHGGEFTGGQTVDELIQLPDLAPTLIDTAGIDAPEFFEQLHGQSFHPDTEAHEREYAIAEYMAPEPALEVLENRVGDLSEEVYKYDRSLRTIRNSEWKLIRGSDGLRELYHVADDPGETNDLAAEHPDKVEELEIELDAWLDSFEHADYSGEVEMRQETKSRLEDLGYLQ